MERRALMFVCRSTVLPSCEMVSTNKLNSNCGPLISTKYNNNLYLKVLFQQSLEVPKFLLFWGGGGDGETVLFCW